MAQTKAEAAAGKKLSGVLAEAHDEVEASAELTGSYAYRFEQYEDGSYIAVYKTSPEAKVEVATFANADEVRHWHPVHQLTPPEEG